MNIIKNYIRYIRDNPNGYWFKRKLYGYGWTPARWQGWGVMVIYISLVLSFVFQMGEVSSISQVLSRFVFPVIFLTLLFLFVVYKKGESLRWQWGDENGDSETISKNNSINIQKYFLFVLVLSFLFSFSFVWLRQGRVSHVLVSPDLLGAHVLKEKVFSEIYSDPSANFSIRYPLDYIVDTSSLSRNGVDVKGVKFFVAPTLFEGTNLSRDSFISVETVETSEECSAKLFFSQGGSSVTLSKNELYSLASTTDAGAGNRYEEDVFALLGTNPCVAVRYFLHYSAIENYDIGMVHEFDKATLFSTFDKIRSTLVVNQ